MGVVLKKQHKTTVDKGMETNALSGFALLLATWVGVADLEVRWARSRVAGPQEAPGEGIGAQRASVCGFEVADCDLRARQGVQWGQAGDNRLSKLKKRSSIKV